MTTISVFEWKREKPKATKQQIAWNPPIGRWQTKLPKFFDSWKSAPSNTNYHRIGKIVDREIRKSQWDFTEAERVEWRFPLANGSQELMLWIEHTAREYDLDPQFVVKIKVRKAKV